MTILGESLAASVAGAALGGLGGWYFGYPKLGAAAGGALGGAAGVVYGTMRATAQSVVGETGDVVGFFPSYPELIAGPGPMTPQRLFLAQQMTPDRYGWTMQPAGLQSAYGPALAKGPTLEGGHGPAYLRMPYNATLPGSTLPPSTHFQQDVGPRAAEATSALHRALERVGIKGHPHRLLNAFGLRFAGSPELVSSIRQVAGEIARQANLAAVLVARHGRQHAVYFTDYPAMLLAQHPQSDRIAGFDVEGLDDTTVAGTASDWIGGPMAHYGISALSGAAAGLSLALARPQDVPRIPAAVGGTVVGLGVAYLTRARKIQAPPGELPTERVGREAIEAASAGQTGRWLNLLLWGPAMIATGYYQPNAIASVASTASGAVLMGSSLLDLGVNYRLRLRHDAAYRKRVAEYVVSRPARAAARPAAQAAGFAHLRARIARLKGTS